MRPLTALYFVYGEEYPADDPTYVEYTDENGDEQTKEIHVPDVMEPEAPNDFAEGDMGIRIFRNSLADDAPISGIAFSIYQVLPGEGDVLSERPKEEEYGKYATAENLVAEITTNANGYASPNLTEKGLGKGFYLVIEHDGSMAVEPVAPFYISVPMADPADGEMMYIINIYPKNVPIEPETPSIEPDLPEEPEEEQTGCIAIIKHSSADSEIWLDGT